MTVIYYHFCDSCGAHHRDEVDTCAKCGSPDMTLAPAFARVDIDDAADNARLATIRAEAAPRYAAMDAAELERLADVARGSVGDGWLRRRQAGGL